MSSSTARLLYWRLMRSGFNPPSQITYTLNTLFHLRHEIYI
jgi:hypothetical protein